MSGHNKWSTIKHKKGKTDAIRGRVFTKIIKEITVAARLGGGDQTANPRLRKAVLDGKANNMPADNIARAIKKGTGELEGVSYEEITYEGYGPGGTAVLVDVTTDNRNRAITEVRMVFNKRGAKLAEPGAVAYLFSAVGQVVVAKTSMAEDDLMMVALDAGAQDVETEEDQYTVVTGFTDLWSVRDKLEAAGVAIVDFKFAKIASTTIELSGKEAESMMTLLEALEDLDDVQNVWSNFDVDAETLAAMSAD
ncbi:MAG: YebC/PmpR family DNA-binding transcriptional regulator [Myxococcales bacterium]|nr:YebC/PmpR family DNA-binding transcriptional regulator [Myxococcales bacterium]